MSTSAPGTQPQRTIADEVAAIREEIGRESSTILTVSMLGPARVGKTSSLTSMVARANMRFAEYGIDLRVASSMASGQLDEKEMQLRLAVNKVGVDINTSLASAIRPDRASHVYPYKMWVRWNRMRLLHLLFIDYPGGWINDPLRRDELINGLRNCDVIQIPIDVPSLMAGGAECERRNSPQLTVKALRLSFTGLHTAFPEQIVFVPLRCEHLLMGSAEEQRKNVDLIVSRIGEEYGQGLATFLASGAVSVSVTPVQTLGGVFFDRYAIDSTGQPNAIYARKSVTDANIYAPRNTEQPLFRILHHALTMKREVINSGAWAATREKISEMLGKKSAFDRLVQRLEPPTDEIQYRKI